MATTGNTLKVTPGVNGVLASSQGLHYQGSATGDLVSFLLWSNGVYIFYYSLIIKIMMMTMTHAVYSD